MPGHLLFLREFVRDPVCLGAVAPSSPNLARLTVAAAGIGPKHVVVELGAGTGPMTAAVVQSHPDNPFMSLEPNATMARALAERFPSVEVAEDYVQHLPDLLDAWGHPTVDRVISSLPWAIWPSKLQNECFDAICQRLSANGRMVTFQYVHSQMLPAAKRFRGSLEDRFKVVHKTRVVWANVPPAFVFVCEGPVVSH